MKIQDKLKQMGEYACLALCYLEMVNIIDDRKPFFILMGMKEGFLDDECTVKNPEGFLELVSGKKYKVTKMNTFDKLIDILKAQLPNTDASVVRMETRLP